MRIALAAPFYIISIFFGLIATWIAGDSLDRELDAHEDDELPPRMAEARRAMRGLG